MENVHIKEKEIDQEELLKRPLIASIDFRLSEDGSIVVFAGTTKFAELYEALGGREGEIQRIILKHFRKPMEEAGIEIDHINNGVVRKLLASYVTENREEESDA